MLLDSLVLYLYQYHFQEYHHEKFIKDMVI